MSRTLFVTTALPYANGSFHIGHIMEYIQADIWVRSLRMAGHTVHFVGADDTHGAPIMLKAEAEGITPQALVARYAAERPQYLNGFHIAFDHWHSTDSVENHELSQDIYRKLRAEGLIETRSIEQFFDPVKGMFLPDRYIKGECPKCHAKDQYGDSCEVCGAVYAATELIDPYSTLTNTRPVLKSSDHFFFKLSDPRCVAFLQEWTTGKQASDIPHLQTEVLAKTREWLGDGQSDAKLGDWDISRDAPYFGIEIPDAPGKYFYVWLDAPVGYLASLKAYCKKIGLDYEALVDPDGKTEQVHFIGKDIVYFHALFWPATLKFSGRKTPDQLNVHGFITVSGEKMSKSRGTGISPLRYLEIGMNPDVDALLHRCQDSTPRSRMWTSTPTTFIDPGQPATWSASTSTSPAVRPTLSASISTASFTTKATRASCKLSGKTPRRKCVACSRPESMAAPFVKSCPMRMRSTKALTVNSLG